MPHSCCLVSCCVVVASPEAVAQISRSSTAGHVHPPPKISTISKCLNSLCVFLHEDYFQHLSGHCAIAFTIAIVPSTPSPLPLCRIFGRNLPAGCLH